MALVRAPRFTRNVLIEDLGIRIGAGENQFRGETGTTIDRLVTAIEQLRSLGNVYMCANAADLLSKQTELAVLRGRLEAFEQVIAWLRRNDVRSKWKITSHLGGLEASALSRYYSAAGRNLDPMNGTSQLRHVQAYKRLEAAIEYGFVDALRSLCTDIDEGFLHIRAKENA